MEHCSINVSVWMENFFRNIEGGKLRGAYAVGKSIRMMMYSEKCQSCHAVFRCMCCVSCTLVLSECM